VVNAWATGWVPSPWFLVTPPQPADTAIDRPRLTALLDTVVARHRVTVVTAPAGFGKTTALAEWARARHGPTAWFSLNHFDVHARQLHHGIVTALRRLAGDVDDARYAPLLTLGLDSRDVHASARATVRALHDVPEPTVLVVDDVHRAGPDAGDGVLGVLVAHAPPSVHLVLAGRETPAVPLQPLRAAGELGEIGRDDLAFTAGEVRAAAAALRRPVTAAQAAQLRSEAAGWPAAVRMALVAGVTGASGPDTLLAEHVAEQILRGLRPALADFVVAATTCGTLDASIAEQLSGQRPGAALLGECMRSGLLLDHFTDTDRQPVYRWHPVFAARCRAVVARRDPERADRLHRVAARALAAANPLRAVIHARRGNDPALALFLLEEHWLELVLRDGAGAVEELCEALPPPWADDPIVLLVRACCSHLRPDRPSASALLARAQEQAQRAGIAGGDRFAAADALAELFLADGDASLAAACDRVGALLRGPTTGWGPVMHACVTFLLGWTELRLRRGPARAVDLLRAAERECRTCGQEVVRRRATANLALALALEGALGEARQVLDPVIADGRGLVEWTSADAGVEWLTDGFLSYWTNDLERAQRSLRVAAACTDDPQSFAALARVFGVFTAVARDEPDALAAAEEALRAVTEGPALGAAWPVYQRVARAMLDLDAGRREQAGAAVRDADDLTGTPLCAALGAEVLRRCGDPGAALERLAVLPADLPSYVAVSALLTRALAEHGDGPRAALHIALEHVLAAAAPEGVVRPFADPDPLLREVLADHRAWGTRHEAFLVACVARGVR
jgi:LuxR family transcriptional regulator, maltose regulon positive regulatory protein